MKNRIAFAALLASAALATVPSLARADDVVCCCNSVKPDGSGGDCHETTDAKLCLADEYSSPGPCLQLGGECSVGAPGSGNKGGRAVVVGGFVAALVAVGVAARWPRRRNAGDARQRATLRPGS
jgi:hypothetical protein